MMRHIACRIRLIVVDEHFKQIDFKVVETSNYQKLLRLSDLLSFILGLPFLFIFSVEI